MDVNTLVAALAATQSMDPAARHAAETALNEHQFTRGQVVNIFRISMEESVDPTIRHMAAISFKNIVKKHWEATESKPSPLAEEDKATIRDNILEAIARAPHHVRSQLEEAMKSIIHEDWPQQWTALMPQLQQYLGSSDQAQVGAALRVLRVMARKYEFRDEAERAVLHALVDATFPMLLPILESLGANPSPSTDLAEMIKLVLKTFWSSMYMDVPPMLVQDEPFRRWMAAIHALLLRPVPLDHMPADSDARKSWQWWKMKKWVMHISYRLFNRYGDPQLCREKTDVAFATRFRNDCALPYLSGVLQALSELSQGAYIHPRVLNLMLQYVTEAMAHKHTWKVLKPHVESIVLSVVLPLLCFNDDDEELWRDDPQEYVRKGYDIIEDMYSTKTAAMNFLHQLCKARAKDNLDMVMQNLLTVLNEHKAVHPAAPPALARRVDGALLAIGTLNDVLREKSRYRAQLEPMLLAHVVPLFQSPYGHLRAKAAWLAGLHADIQFAGGKGKGPTFGSLLQHVVQALQDPDLPVKVDAAVAIRNFLDAVDDGDLDAFKPLVPQLLQHFLALSQETESEDLTFSLEAVIERFGSDIAPYAVDVCTALAHQFWRIATTEAEDGDDDEDVGPLGAYSVLRAMGTVLESVSSLPQLYPQLEDIIYPIVDRYCSSEGADVFEEVTQLITYLTYFGSGISPKMWTLYPKLLAALDEWALDYFDCIIMPLDNYISRATDVFIASTEPNFLEMTNRSLEKALQSDTDNEELACAPKVMGVVMQHCKGRVNHCIGPYLALSLQRLAKCEPDETVLRDALLTVIADALYYNPVLTLGQLAAQGALEQGLEVLFQAVFTNRKSGKMKHFPSKRDKKICVLGLSALLTVPDGALPPSAGPAALGRAVTAVVRVLVALKKQEEEAQQEFGSDADSEEGGESGNESDDEDDSEEEEELLNEAAINRMRRRAAKRASFLDDDPDDFSDDEWWDEDDDDVMSPIDDINPYVYFAEALQQVQGGNPARFASLTGVMDAGVQQAVQGMMVYAAEVRQAQAAAAAAGGS